MAAKTTVPLTTSQRLGEKVSNPDSFQRSRRWSIVTLATSIMARKVNAKKPTTYRLGRKLSAVSIAIPQTTSPTQTFVRRKRYHELK